MPKCIFLKAARSILDPKDQSKERPVYHLEYSELDGTMVKAQVICTSSNFKNDTFNFKFPDSGEIRTVHAQLLCSINGMEVML